MENTCKFVGGGYCLCDVCQSMRKELEKAEKIPLEEVDELFREAEEIFAEMKKSENLD